MDTGLLIDHLRTHSRPMEPVETGERPVLPQLDGLKAVVFDIYGTLFISGSGDISLAKAEDRSPAIRAALETAGFAVRQPEADWSGAFLRHLEAFRKARKSAGVEFPEVRIEEVWESFVGSAIADEWLGGEGNLRLAIVDHECRVNPCWPMPGVTEMLACCLEAGLQLGIVSNAQFYTPLLFPALLDQSMENLAFDADLCVWSYREREGKPSKGLYTRLAAALVEKGIKPEAVLYIGNDRRNDIWPAQACGFRTALFAGDKRSLRWRRKDPDCQAAKPDGILTDWAQLAQSVLPQS